jgi:cysteinyl-tRNA synthetase
MAVLFDLANEVNRSASASAARQLKMLAGTLGLLQRAPQEFLQSRVGDGQLTDEVIVAKIEARKVAKQSRNFAEADRIRSELLDGGIVLEDNAAGTTWRRG